MEKMFQKDMLCTRAVPEVQGDEILKFWDDECGGFLVANILSFFPRKNRLEFFVTENFTTLFTARKDICHLELTPGASSPNMFFDRDKG